MRTFRKTVILAGVGGIGSYVGFLLARMKPSSMFIYDDDIVEAVNMSGQLYGQSDLGIPKVSALAEMIRNYAGYSSVFAISERFTDESEALDIMICGFDNMAARRLFFNKWVNHVQSKPEEERKNCLFIDGRLAAEEFQVLCIKEMMSTTSVGTIMSSYSLMQKLMKLSAPINKLPSVQI